MADPQTSTLPAMVRAKFPGVYDDLSDAELDAKVRAKFPGVYDDLPGPSQTPTPPPSTPSSTPPSTIGGLALAATGASIPLLAQATRAFAQSPAAVNTGGAIARGLATVASIAHGLKANPLEMLATPTERAVAETLGKIVTKGAQSVAGPVATGLETVSPYAQSLWTLGAAQGVNNLAQMAEPNRTDIGFLGIGPSSAGNTTLQQPAAQLQAVQYLIDTKKLSPMAAVAAVTGNNPQLAGQLMMRYTQAPSVKK